MMPEPFMWQPFRPKISSRIPKKYKCVICDKWELATEMRYDGPLMADRDEKKFICKKHHAFIK
jgi:hypothetical protein